MMNWNVRKLSVLFSVKRDLDPPPQPMKSTKLILRTKNKAVLIFESFDEFIKCVYSKKKVAEQNFME